MSPSDAEIDALEQLQEAIESGDVSLLRKLLNQTDLGGRRELGGALVVGHDVEERRQGVQRAGRHHDDVYAVLRGAGRRRAVERGRQGEFFLSRPRLRVLGSDGRGGASTAAAAVRWSRGVASVPWGRRAARGRRLFWPGT